MGKGKWEDKKNKENGLRISKKGQNSLFSDELK
jgi:hypothetical protein